MDDEAPDYIPPQPFFPRMSRRTFFLMALPLIIVSLAIIAVTLFSAYQMAEKRKIAEIAPLAGTAVEVTATMEEETVPDRTTTVSAPELGEGWTYQSVPDCPVRFPIPPKSEPYYYPVTNPAQRVNVGDLPNSGKFWDFPRGAAYPNLLSKLMDEGDDWKQSATTLASEDEASGAITMMVAVSCIPNNGRFENNDGMFSELAARIAEYNSSEKEVGMEPANYEILEHSGSARWERDVLDLKVWEDPQENPYTMFVTPHYIYEVRVITGTTDQFANETALRIFDNLSFE